MRVETASRAPHARKHGSVLAFAGDGPDVDVAGAGQLHAALIDGSGAEQPLHGRAGALGTGIDPANSAVQVRLRRDDLVVAATIPIDRAWWSSGDRTASGLLHRTAEHHASVAIVAFA
jgi:hypothetical protein